jgi:hypothetical protein
MPTQSMPDPASGVPQHSRLKKTLCAVLVLIPVVLALSVPFYQRTTPTLGGLPFFYWFQMAMAVAAAGACGITYFVLFRHEKEMN